MKRLFAGAIAIIAALSLAGCKVGGDSALVPTAVTVTPGDGYVTVTWTATPGVDYWLYRAPTTSTLTPENCSSFIGCGTTLNASSPQIVMGLANGTAYSFTISGRTGSGTGGPGSASVTATPRLAGATWSVGSFAGSNDLRGVTHSPTEKVFVAVGASGAIFSSTDGSAWTALTTPLAPANSNLNAAVYGGHYLAAGAGGVMLLSSDGATWTQQATPTTKELYALATNGADGYVAVGADSAIVVSNGGSTWTVAGTVPSPASTLYAATYGNGKFVAVGAGGALLTSSDGNTWQTVASNTTVDLKGVAYGAGTFVAIGASGTLVTSTDGTIWTVQTPISTDPALKAVTYGHQFIAVGDAGAVFTSTDGLVWTKQTSNTSDNLYAVTGYLNIYNGAGYSAVGVMGRNLSSI